MISPAVIDQPQKSIEFSMCRGFEFAINGPAFVPNRRFTLKYLNHLIKSPSKRQASFFGRIAHTIEGEPALCIIDQSRVLWLEGARVLGLINCGDVATEYIRRFNSGLKGLIYGK
jgi:hypothetical protein